MSVSDSELLQRQDSCPAAGTYWRHYRRGTLYIVLGSCIDEATLKPCVLYRRADIPEGPVFCRPLESWQVVRVGGIDWPRFNEEKS